MSIKQDYMRALDATPSSILFEGSFSTGNMALRPQQSNLINAVKLFGCALAEIPVGGGKTLALGLCAQILGGKILYFAGTSVKDCKRVEGLLKEYRNNGVTVPELTPVSYGTLSSTKGFKLVEDFAPDVLLLDEIHLLYGDSARTKRIASYIKNNPHVRIVGVTGTLFKNIDGLCNVCKWIFGENSPMPISWAGIYQFKLIVDLIGNMKYKNSNAPAPDRSTFMNVRVWFDTFQVPIVYDYEDGASLRAIIKERLLEFPAILLEEGSSCDVPITWHKLDFKSKVAIDDVVKYWVDPEGEPLESAAHLEEVKLQLLQGFYYRDKWPNNVKDEAWLEARRNWRSKIGEVLRASSKWGDSYGTVLKAVKEGVLNRRDILEAFEAWEEASKRKGPEQEEIWVDDSFVRAIINFDGIIWTHHGAVRNKLRELGHPLVIDAGKAPPSQKGPIVLSIRSHGVGYNLQHHHRVLITVPPTKGDTLEQLLGRVHRSGQEKPVQVYFLAWGLPRLEAAKRDSARQASLSKVQLKILQYPP